MFKIISAVITAVVAAAFGGFLVGMGMPEVTQQAAPVVGFIVGAIFIK